MALDVLIHLPVIRQSIVSRLACFDGGEGRYILEEVFYG